MKTIIKILITFTVLNSINLKTYPQDYNLNIPNVFQNPLNCGLWCWVFTSQNIINYYEGSSPSTLELVEWARLNGLFDPDPGSCITTPLNCCLTGEIFIDDWNLRCKAYNPPLTRDTLVNQFRYNQPVIIHVSGHVFIAEGISGPDSVCILDGFLGRCKRNINNIYPNKPLLSYEVMKHSPNWSVHNDISIRFTQSKCFSSSSLMSINAVFEKDPSNPTQYFSFRTNGNIYLYNDFKVYPGCDLIFYTNNSNCP